MKRIFDKLRRPDKARSLFSYVFFAIVFGAIILVFALLSPGGGGSLNGSGSVAKVGSQVISVADYQRRVQNLESSYRGIFGGNAGGGQFTKMIQQQALEGLVQDALLEKSESKTGFVVTDEALVGYLKQIPQFNDDGKFRKSLYKRFIESQNFTPQKFEKMLKDELRMNKARQVFNSAFSHSSFATDKLKELTGHKYELKYISFTPENIKSKVNVGSETVAQVLANPAELEKVKLHFEKNPTKYVLDQKLTEGAKKIEPHFESLKEKAAEDYLKLKGVNSFSDKVAELLKSKDFNAVNDLLKKNKVEFKTTNEFDLTSKQIPGIGESEQFLTAAMGLEQPGDFHPKLIMYDSAPYLVKLAKLTREEPKSDPNDPAAARPLDGQLLFKSWMERMRANSKIQVSEQLFSNES